MLFFVRTLAAGALAASIAVQAGFSDDEKEAIAAGLVPTSYEVERRAFQVLESHAPRADADSYEYLISQGAIRHLGFVASWHPGRTKVLQPLVLRHWDNRPVATALIRHLDGYDDPAVFERLFQDVQAYASWRAEARTNCRYERATRDDDRNLVFPVRFSATVDKPAAVWEARCVAGADPNTYIGRTVNIQNMWFVPEAEMRFEREKVSLSTIAKSAIPGVEARLVPLVRDLSLRLPVEDLGDGRWPYYDQAQPPEDLLRGLLKRRARIELTTLKQIVELHSRNLALADASPSYYWGVVHVLLAHLLLHESKEATTLVTSRIMDATLIRDPDQRERTLEQLVMLLGSVPPSAQVGYEPLRDAILSRVEDKERRVSNALSRIAEERRALREAGPDSLVTWLDSPRYLSEQQERDRTQAIRDLLARGAPVNAVGHKGLTPLVAACSAAPALVPLLLEHGADVNLAAGPRRETPLLVAIRSGAKGRSNVSLLLSKGADPQAPDAEGNVPLHVATEANDREMVKALLTAGARVDATNAMGWTPLRKTVNVDVATLLLDAGADPNRLAPDGESPYSKAGGSHVVPGKDGGYSIEASTPELARLMASRGGRLTPAQMAKRAASAITSSVLIPLIMHGQRH